jgi:hypothetical protein
MAEKHKKDISTSLNMTKKRSDHKEAPFLFLLNGNWRQAYNE